MKVEGERSFAAPRATVWEVLNDPAKMAELMPGVESFDVQDDRHWTANVKIPLGLGGLRMSMRFDKVEEREPEYARLNAKGTGVGAMLSMQTAFDLSEADGGTVMKWEADVSIAGPVGAMGQRVLQPIVNQQVGQVLNGLDRQVSGAAAGWDEAAPADADDFEAAPPAPAEPTPEADPAEGASGADEGISPLSPETYSEDPQGPTTSTEDTR
ncbi:MAG: CoxG family protein [Gaiellaceae bacterium]